MWNCYSQHQPHKLSHYLLLIMCLQTELQIQIKKPNNCHSTTSSVGCLLVSQSKAPGGTLVQISINSLTARFFFFFFFVGGKRKDLRKCHRNPVGPSPNPPSTQHSLSDIPMIYL